MRDVKFIEDYGFVHPLWECNGPFVKIHNVIISRRLLTRVSTFVFNEMLRNFY